MNNKLLGRVQSLRGYSTFPIYGIYLGPGEYMIFCGEEPQRLETGAWKYDSECPRFRVTSFPGSHLLAEHPEKAHLIHIESYDYCYSQAESNEKYQKELGVKIYNLEEKIKWCSFKTYAHGLWNRIKSACGTFSHAKGEYMQVLCFTHQPRKGKAWKISFSRLLDNSEIYFCLETDRWWRFLFLRSEGKFTIKTRKEENTHTYTSI